MKFKIFHVHNGSAAIGTYHWPTDDEFERADVLQQHWPGNTQFDVRIYRQLVIIFKTDALFAHIFRAAGTEKDSASMAV